jgi:hypothetical protein
MKVWTFLTSFGRFGKGPFPSLAEESFEIFFRLNLKNLQFSRLATSLIPLMAIWLDRWAIWPDSSPCVLRGQLPAPLKPKNRVKKQVKKERLWNFPLGTGFFNLCFPGDDL